VANPSALGIFGFSFLDQNEDKIQGALVDEAEPTFDNIADGKYAIARSLYYYVKKAHVGKVPGLEEFLHEFTSDRASGEDGYLADRGLIPLPTDDRMTERKNAKALMPLQL
jgi:phosphate transport system substrate-binding protein